MENILVVVDMQNDFIDGSLGTNEAQLIVDNVVNEITSGKYNMIYYTRDTHFNKYTYIDGEDHEAYNKTNEGRHLPVKHCIYNTKGWRVNSKVMKVLNKMAKDIDVIGIDKYTFGTMELCDCLNYGDEGKDQNITLVGLCTDICVVSNALLLKNQLPEANIFVLKDCCAGVTPEKHFAALETMRSCQIEVI